MSEVELDKIKKLLIIHADIFFYGNAAGETISQQIAADIATHWNEPQASVKIKNEWYKIIFSISGFYTPGLTEVDVYQNDNPRNNYFRIEDFASGNISFVDGINSNTGYFKRDNLLNNSTTAAHEFGHTIGLKHPDILDIRGMGTPGLMYPRGTIVDAVFQYDPNAAPLQPGGTMNPFARKVLLKDIENLDLPSLEFNEKGLAVLGDFTSIWHDAHKNGTPAN